MNNFCYFNNPELDERLNYTYIIDLKKLSKEGFEEFHQKFLALNEAMKGVATKCEINAPEIPIVCDEGDKIVIPGKYEMENQEDFEHRKEGLQHIETFEQHYIKELKKIHSENCNKTKKLKNVLEEVCYAKTIETRKKLESLKGQVDETWALINSWFMKIREKERQEKMREQAEEKDRDKACKKFKNEGIENQEGEAGLKTLKSDMLEKLNSEILTAKSNAFESLQKTWRAIEASNDLTNKEELLQCYEDLLQKITSEELSSQDIENISLEFQDFISCKNMKTMKQSSLNRVKEEISVEEFLNDEFQAKVNKEFEEFKIEKQEYDKKILVKAVGSFDKEGRYLISEGELNYENPNANFSDINNLIAGYNNLIKQLLPNQTLLTLDVTSENINSQMRILLNYHTEIMYSEDLNLEKWITINKELLKIYKAIFPKIPLTPSQSALLKMSKSGAPVYILSATMPSEKELVAMFGKGLNVGIETSVKSNQFFISTFENGNPSKDPLVKSLSIIRGEHCPKGINKINSIEDIWSNVPTGFTTPTLYLRKDENELNETIKNLKELIVKKNGGIVSLPGYIRMAAVMEYRLLHAYNNLKDTKFSFDVKLVKELHNILEDLKKFNPNDPNNLQYLNVAKRLDAFMEKNNKFLGIPENVRPKTFLGSRPNRSAQEMFAQMYEEGERKTFQNMALLNALCFMSGNNMKMSTLLESMSPSSGNIKDPHTLYTGNFNMSQFTDEFINSANLGFDLDEIKRRIDSYVANIPLVAGRDQIANYYTKLISKIISDVRTEKENLGTQSKNDKHIFDKVIQSREVQDLIASTHAEMQALSFIDNGCNPAIYTGVGGYSSSEQAKVGASFNMVKVCNTTCANNELSQQGGRVMRGGDGPLTAMIIVSNEIDPLNAERAIRESLTAAQKTSCEYVDPQIGLTHNKHHFKNFDVKKLNCSNDDKPANTEVRRPQTARTQEIKALIHG